MLRSSSLAVAGLLALACSRPTALPGAPPAPALSIPLAGTAGAPASAAVPEPAAVTGSVAFCGFGGQGVVGIGQAFDSTIRVVLVVDVTAAAVPPGAHLSLSSIALRNDEGVVEAEMRGAPIAIVRVDPVPPKTTWESAMRPDGAPFVGTLGAGVTRLRVEAWLTHHPRSFPLRVHVALDGPSGPIELDGKVDGEWPTA